MKQNIHSIITVTVPVINELTLPRQLSVQTSCTKFEENPTNRIGADTRSQTDGRMGLLYAQGPPSSSQRTPKRQYVYSV